MATRLLIILGVIAALVLILIAVLIIKSIACGKIKKAILSLSEHPDEAQAKLFAQQISKISPVGIFFAKHSGGYSGLSKGECRTIYNSTVLPSGRISEESKKKVRACLVKIGCTGLTDTSCM